MDKHAQVILATCIGIGLLFFLILAGISFLKAWKQVVSPEEVNQLLAEQRIHPLVLEYKSPPITEKNTLYYANGGL